MYVLVRWNCDDDHTSGRGSMWLCAVTMNHLVCSLPIHAFSKISCIRNVAFPNFLWRKHFSLSAKWWFLHELDWSEFWDDWLRIYLSLFFFFPTKIDMKCRRAGKQGLHIRWKWEQEVKTIFSHTRCALVEECLLRLNK